MVRQSLPLSRTTLFNSSYTYSDVLREASRVDRASRNDHLPLLSRMCRPPWTDPFIRGAPVINSRAGHENPSSLYTPSQRSFLRRFEDTRFFTPLGSAIRVWDNIVAGRRFAEKKLEPGTVKASTMSTGIFRIFGFLKEIPEGIGSTRWNVYPFAIWITLRLQFSSPSKVSIIKEQCDLFSLFGNREIKLKRVRR